MTEIDMLLRDTLRERAEEAPAANELLGKVRDRSRRLNTRRRIGAAGVAMVAVMFAAAGTPLVGQLVRTAPPAADTAWGVGSGATADPSPSPSRMPERSLAPFAVALGPPTYDLPAFPFVPPMSAIARFGPARVWFDSDGLALRHVPPTGGAGPSVTVQVAEGEPHVVLPDTTGTREEQVLVRGVRGTRHLGPGSGPAVSYLVWQEHAGPWVLVTGYQVPADEVQRYAEGLVPGKVPTAAPFEFDALPRGMELEQANPAAMVFRPADLAANAGLRGKLAVRLDPAKAPDDPASWGLKAGGRRARIYRNGPDSRLLQVALDKSRTLSIQVWDNFTVTDDTLLKLAAGVRVTAAAVPGGG